jgi:N-acetylglucosaminyldiphosphoundecaprenol N-acetyl-beta-D-mannosaminyltransferase
MVHWQSRTATLVTQQLSNSTGPINDRSMPERTDVLGVGVSAINLPMAVDIIGRWVELGEQRYVCVTGVHGVMESCRDDEVRRIHSMAGLVTPDGMPMVWLLRLAGHRHTGRVYGPDLMRAVFGWGQERRTRHFLYGSTPETLKGLKSKLLERFPEACIVGIHSPPNRPAGAAEDDAVCGMIDDSSADIVWVGLSTPKQEVWMARHRSRLRAPVLIGVGAAFDILSGTVRQAPRVLQLSGFEWLFRLAHEPRRLAGRYLRNNPAFILLILKQKMGLRRQV